MRWRVAWIALAAAAVAAFFIIEVLALHTPDGGTLSQTVVDLLYAWPPAGYLLAWLSGVLVCHFTWPWVPKQLRAICGECGETILLGERKKQ